MRLKMFLGREPCNENFLSGSAIASDEKNIEYSRRLDENFRLRNVGACLPFQKFMAYKWQSSLNKIHAHGNDVRPVKRKENCTFSEKLA